MVEISALEKERAGYEPRIPSCLKEDLSNITLQEGDATSCLGHVEEIKKLFPHTFGHPLIHLVQGNGNKKAEPLNIGVVLSGGQAPGGHNVITGIFDQIKAIHPQSRLFGFLGGPKGIFTGEYTELTTEIINDYRNSGGFDMIGSGRDKIDKPEQLEACKTTCKDRNLQALVIIGGDDSNTNAAVLAEHFIQQGTQTCVIGVPKTIDGDLKNEYVEVPFGYDTASKVYSELIGNICRDAKSARKYWHFIKLMGRNASHVALECALQTHANITLIGEEVKEKKQTLEQIVVHIAGVLKRRAQAGKYFGVCLVPEGLIEFIPEIRTLIKELNHILEKHEDYFKTIDTFPDRQEFINQKLTRDSSYVFSSLPARIQEQLLRDRDSHGNVQVSKIETEKLLIEQVSELFAQWKSEARSKWVKERKKESGEKSDEELKKEWEVLEGSKWEFSTQSHFLGYEGRCAAPSNFDANYTYALGRTAAILAAFRKTGYMCAVTGLTNPPVQWQPCGIPITSLLNMEVRKGKRKPVIKKALVMIDGEPFKQFASHRERWETEDEFVYPGAIQYFGKPEVTDVPIKTLLLERANYDSA